MWSVKISDRLFLESLKIMNNYYFLGTLLPDLKIGEPPELGFKELDQLMKDNLSKADYEKTRTLRQIYDIANLKAYWKGKPFDSTGNLNAKELEEAELTRTRLPDYVFTYIDKYPTNEERLQHYPELLSSFYQNAIKNSSGLFKDFLILERDIRIILAAFRAKKLGKDIYKELQYEDPNSDLVAQILAQKDSSTYEPPEKYQEIKHFFDQYYDDPIELQKALIDYSFTKINEQVDTDLFSIDRILSYMIEVIMVEKWMHMDKQKGLQIVDSMMKEP